MFISVKFMGVYVRCCFFQQPSFKPKNWWADVPLVKELVSFERSLLNKSYETHTVE